VYRPRVRATWSPTPDTLVAFSSRSPFRTELADRRTEDPIPRSPISASFATPGVMNIGVSPW